jgi:hypothetical protein
MSQSFFERALSRNGAGKSGWNGQPGRSRRQPAAELRLEDLSNQMVPARPTQSGGRVARRNGPVARSTSLLDALSRLGTLSPKSAFSVLEIMVAVALLAVIIVGLLAMFYQVQRAFRAGTSQVDVMEGGRAAISIIAREMQEVATMGVPDATNLVIVPSYPRILTSQTLSSGDVQQDFLQDFCFIQRRNDEWTGVAYRFTNAFTGVGTLIRYSWSWASDSNPLWLADTNRMMSRDVCSWPPNRYDGASQLLDGVVHFQVEAYDADGVLYRTYSDTTPLDEPYLHRDKGKDVYAFLSTNLPAYLDIELRVLEPATLAKFRARAQTDLDNATNYLARQIGHTHVFRQRIPVRTAGTLAF